MLLSMTGFGEARGHDGPLSFGIEVRSVNNRHLKVNLRAPEPYNLFEAEFEKVVRRQIRRGTILIFVRITRQSRAEDFRLNQVALRSYLKQIASVREELDATCRPSLDAVAASVLLLPGVAADEVASAADVDVEWPILEAGLCQALAGLQAMRADEGARMAVQFEAWRREIALHLEKVCELQPRIAIGIRDRLRERVRTLVADSSIVVRDEDLAREVALLADRADIAEETVRLSSHLEQFGEILKSDSDSPGRKLEFVLQEMGRETNTMGAKAGDVEISRRVVEIKAVLEKIREMLQNVE